MLKQTGIVGSVWLCGYWVKASWEWVLEFVRAEGEEWTGM